MNKLDQWLNDNRPRKRQEFAKSIGLSASYLSRLCKDPPAYWPSQDKWEAIRRETAGAVTPNDFLPPFETAGRGLGGDDGALAGDGGGAGE